MKKVMKKVIKLFLGIAILVGAVSFAMSSGCTLNDVFHAVGYNNVPIDHKSVHELPVGDPLEERVFDVGEHIVYMRVSTLDENGERISRGDVTGFYTFNLPNGYKILDDCFYQTNDGKYDVEFFYHNIVPVKAVANENGEFLELGTPVSK